MKLLLMGQRTIAEDVLLTQHNGEGTQIALDSLAKESEILDDILGLFEQDSCRGVDRMNRRRGAI